MSNPDLVEALHEPVTNIVTAVVAHESLVSPPTPGQGAGAPDPQNGVEAIGSVVRPESSVVATAPDKVLEDVGRAAFADSGLVLETVHGADDRVQVEDTTPYPWSANASLLITARDGSQWIGTGWFVSGRTLITAGHCVYISGSGIPGRDGWVRSIEVMPGRNGSSLPFGSVSSSEFWTVRGWAEHGDENYDYAAIIIPTPLGDTVGTFGFGVFSDAELTQRVVNIGGYPGDKPVGTMWFAARQIAALGPAKVHYDIDTAGGQSGAAVYLIDDAGQRISVAVHAYGGATTNSGTRISPPVFRNISSWKV